MAKSAFTEGYLPTLSNYHGAIQGLWGLSGWHQSVSTEGCDWCQTAANDCFDLSCGLSSFLSLTEYTALLSVSRFVSLWGLQPASGCPPAGRPGTPYNMPFHDRLVICHEIYGYYSQSLLRCPIHNAQLAEFLTILDRFISTPQLST